MNTLNEEDNAELLLVLLFALAAFLNALHLDETKKQVPIFLLIRIASKLLPFCERVKITRVEKIMKNNLQ